MKICKIETEDGDITRAHFKFKRYKPSVISESSRMNKYMVDNIIDPIFGFPSKYFAGLFSGYDLMRDENLDSEILYRTVKI